MSNSKAKFRGTILEKNPTEKLPTNPKYSTAKSNRIAYKKIKTNQQNFFTILHLIQKKRLNTTETLPPSTKISKSEVREKNLGSFLQKSHQTPNIAMQNPRE